MDDMTTPEPQTLTEALVQMLYRFANVPLLRFPYTHFYVEQVFPEDFYKYLRSQLPARSDMPFLEEKRPVRGYRERRVQCFDPESLAALPAPVRAFWSAFSRQLLDGRFMHLLLSRFRPLLDPQLAALPDSAFRNEMMVVRDDSHYTLGPHTDARNKVVTIVLYLAPDDSNPKLGTSIYTPRRADFLCEGGPHYARDGFVRMCTMPYKANSAFGFIKGRNSFHGVEPVPEGNPERCVLLYDVYRAPGTDR